MTNIVILGAGVMGSALAVPASKHNSNSITLVGSPLDDDWIASINATRMHPTLRVKIPERVDAITEASLTSKLLQAADIIVIAVSSPGVRWALSTLQNSGNLDSTLTLVTKGLVACQDDSPPLTYADALLPELTGLSQNLVGIGGPCIARELALELPTQVVFASRLAQNAERLREVFQTPYYRVTCTQDIVGVEACAALKNFMCIGVSAMLSRYTVGEAYAKNPVSALFNQAVVEMAGLVAWLRTGSAESLKHKEFTDAAQRSRSDAVFDLAGMGDLHVTVGGGRNSRLGKELGKGNILSAVLADSMHGVTVEGVDTGQVLNGPFKVACANGELQVANFPLTHAILNCIERDEVFEFDFELLPG